MQIFVLRAKWEEHYDCPDNGDTKICDAYEDVKFSNWKAELQRIADDLNSGFRGRYWSEKRADELRRMDPNYNDSRENIKYEVDEVTLELTAE
jgi:hypothetical protein